MFGVRLKVIMMPPWPPRIVNVSSAVGSLTVLTVLTALAVAVAPILAAHSPTKVLEADN